MKKLQLKLDSIKNMLTKEQMKKISGGYGGQCPSDPSLLFCDCQALGCISSGQGCASSICGNGGPGEPAGCEFICGCEIAGC